MKLESVAQKFETFWNENGFYLCQTRRRNNLSASGCSRKLCNIHREGKKDNMKKI